MENLNQKRILFIGGANGKDEWMVKISKEFESRFNTKSFYLNMLKGGKKCFLDHEIEKEKIYAWYHEEQKEIFEPDMDFIKRCEGKYHFNIWTLWQITAPRKKSRLKLKSKTILCWTEYIIKKTEEMIESSQIDFALFQGLASFFVVIVHNILKQYGIEVMTIVNSRIPNRFTISDTNQGNWGILKQEYKKIKKRNLNEGEIDFAKSFIQEFKEKKFKPDDSTKVEITFKSKLKKYIRYAKILKTRKQIPDLRQFLWPTMDKILDYTGRFESPPEKKEKFAFYPLHVDPEASTLLFGNLYVNQLDIIEKLSKSLPCDFYLYVKEHTFNYSSRPSYFHKEIKKYPNVRLITPHINSFDLIKKCSLIFTVTGTVGWEGILLQKPVITFGNVYYNIFEKVTKIGEIKKLPSMIKERIEEKVDEEESLKFITAVFNSTFQGSGAEPADCNNKSFNPKNITKIVIGIAKYINQKKGYQNEVL